MRCRRIALAIVLVLSLDVPAFGHGEAGSQLPADAPAVTKDGEKAKAELGRVAAVEAARALTTPPANKSKAALARAHGARLAGDETGAKLLSRVALAWAQAAGATLRAFEIETRADAGEAQARSQKDEIQRKKSLLVELEARKMSLLAEVANAEKVAPPVASATPVGAAEKDAKQQKPAPKKSAPDGAPKQPATKAKSGGAPKK